MEKSWGSRDPLGAVLNGLERHFQAVPGPRAEGELPAYGQIPSNQTERGGFEPPKDRKALTGFRDPYGRVPSPSGLQGFLDSGSGRGEVDGEVEFVRSSAAVQGRGAALSAPAR
jgi:hypothetical protein